MSGDEIVARDGEGRGVLDGPPTPVERIPRRLTQRLQREARTPIVADRRGYILRRLFAISDLSALMASWGLVVGLRALLGRHDLLPGELGVFALVLPLWLLVASGMGLYHLPDRRFDYTAADEIGPIALAVTVWSWILLLARAAAFIGPVELLLSIGVWAIAIALIPAGRALTRTLARHGHWYPQRTVVVGTPGDVRMVSRRIARHPELGLELIYTIEFDELLDRAGGRPEARVLGVNGAGGVPVREELVDAITRIIESNAVGRVILATSPGDLRQRSELLRILADRSVHVDLVSADADIMSTGTVVHHIEGLPLLTIPVICSTRAARALKRGMDVAVSGSALLFLSPLLTYCALRIKLDSPGPVFFRQERIGLHGHRFRVLKFRTMVSDAEARKAELDALNLHRDTETPGMFKIPGDPRITRFGAWLRRWSLDEVPQLWNVLKGDMSLVGPRPLIPLEASQVAGPYEARFAMRPGITGRWQTLGRSDIGFDDMVKLDYTYVVAWSFSEDVKLLLRTPGVVADRRGAY